MKKYAYFSKLGFLGLVAALCLPATVGAATFMSDDNIVVNQTVDDNLYVAGGNPVVTADVNGDLFIAGGNVNVSGRVKGDLGAAGGNVNLTGPVDGDVRVFGGSVYIDSTIGGEAFSFGGQVTYGPNARVGRDLVVGGENLMVPPGIQVGGETRIFESKDEPAQERPREAQVLAFLTAAFWVGLFFSILAYLAVAAALMGAFPGIVKKYIQRGLASDVSFWKYLGLGLLFLIVTPIASFILMATVVGFMLGAIILLMWIVYIMVSLVVAGLLLGGLAKRLITKEHTPIDWAWGLGGVAVLPILSAIPFIGWLVGLVFFLWAMGTIMTGDFYTFRSVRE